MSTNDPGLDKELDRLGRILSKPSPPRNRNLFHALVEGGDMTPPPEPQPLRNISPNQFAFPGMESQAHPLAAHVAAGVHFEVEHSPASPQGAAGHHITALADGGGQIGSLSWAGANAQRRPDGSGHFPGEIAWVGRHPAASYKGPGLMTDMYKAGHQLNMGQDTVPVHSPDRTPAGEAWSAKTGMSHLRPPHGDLAWRPPEGTHPYERAGNPRQLAPAMEGQGELFERGVGRKPLFQGTGRNRSTAPVDRPNRAVAERTFHNGVRVR